MAKKVKKLEDVKPVEEEIKEEPIVEETTEAETLPKVEFNEEVAPRGYSTVIPHVEDKNPLKMKDGRIYKDMGNGLGMFLDNGSVFKL